MKKKSAKLLTALLFGGAVSLSTAANTVIFTSNFDTSNDISAGNDAGTPRGTVVSAPVGFTSASGNVLRFEAAINNQYLGFSILSDPNLDLPANLDPNGTWSVTFDMYIPTTLAEGNVVGGITHRWNADASSNNINNNGATDVMMGGNNNFSTDFLGGAQQVRLAGVYSNSYGGNIPTGLDPARPTTPTADTLLFNINFQNGIPSENVVYFDNIVFSVDTVPEPSAALLSGLGVIGLGLIRRRR